MLQSDCLKAKFFCTISNLLDKIAITKFCLGKHRFGLKLADIQLKVKHLKESEFKHESFYTSLTPLQQLMLEVNRKYNHFDVLGDK